MYTRNLYRPRHRPLSPQFSILGVALCVRSSFFSAPIGFPSSFSPLLVFRFPRACFLWYFILMPLSCSHVRRFSLISSMCLCSPNRMSFALHPLPLMRFNFCFASFVCGPHERFRRSPLLGFCFSPFSFLFLYFFHVSHRFIFFYSVKDHMVDSIRYVYRARQMGKLSEVCRHILGSAQH